MLKYLTALASDESGATAMEYALIAALISLVGIASFISLGNSLSTIYNAIASNVMSAAGG